MPRAKHSHNAARWAKDYTAEELETLRKCFDLSFLQTKPIADATISYYKYSYSVGGRIGQYHFSASNESEYRTNISYDSTKPFYLRDFDYLSIRVWVVDRAGTNHEIYYSK